MTTRSRPRVLVIGIDGYEQTLGEAMMAEGGLPHLAALAQRSGHFLLDHGDAARTGLAGEHFSTGLTPGEADRWAPLSFDPKRYVMSQVGTTLPPFAAFLKARTVVFDTTYFDLRLAPDVQGIVNWGAHDPGMSAVARPDGLLEEFVARFGAYPARKWLYATPWPSPEACSRMGEAQAAAIGVRSKGAQWLLGERLPDWDLALVFPAELHSATEALWHGVDPAHPLHQAPSAAAAGEALRLVYRAADEFIGDLVAKFADATVVVMAMGGMGLNDSDIASMALLGEVLYRDAFGSELLTLPAGQETILGGYPTIPEQQSWNDVIADVVPEARSTRAANFVASRSRGIQRRLIRAGLFSEHGPLKAWLDWMPTDRYRPYWHKMPAFAVPSMYDGRIRVNLKGRERDGIVTLEEYPAVVDRIEELVLALTDSVTGEPVVERTMRYLGDDPRAMSDTKGDLEIIWRGVSAGFDHPRLGRIGPLPLRRTGGHTGPYGVAYVAAPGVTPGRHGVVSSFDMAASVAELLGESLPPHMSSRSILGAPLASLPMT